MTSEDLYHIYLKDVWRLHGTSDKLITDRGPQYSSKFAKGVNKNLQIETALSTAYHPQTDGQSERTNQEVEQALRAVVDHHATDWVDWLPLVEFALNNRFVKSLGTTPFYANNGFHPRIGSLPQIDTNLESVEDFVKHIHQVQEDMKVSLIQAAEDMKKFYDRNHDKTPEYHVKDKVLLDNANLSLTNPVRKLAERRSGPFTIEEVIGTHNYRLNIPLDWKKARVHDVFHVSLLRPYHEDPKKPNFVAPPPEIVQGRKEYEVESILQSRFRGNTLQFLVKWKDYPDCENSWEPEENVANASEEVKAFYKAHSGAPRRLPDGTKLGVPFRRSARKIRALQEFVPFRPLPLDINVETWPIGPMTSEEA